MKRKPVDVRRLADFLSARLDGAAVALAPLDVRCAWPVFRATVAGREPMFVKLTASEAARRALAFLGAAAGCSFLPRPVLDDAPAFDEFAVVCLEWKDAKGVNAEDMTEGQLGGFLGGCLQLSAILADYRGPVAPLAAEDTPEGQYEILLRYAKRHPLAGRLLKPLLSVPENERAYGNRRLVTIHGDLQPKNYGFDGDRLAAVYDTDDLTQGLACEDAAYAFTERARRSELSSPARRRLCALFSRMVEASPWPREDWLVAVNHARLRIAARRLENHPDSAFVAFDIARRDRPLRALIRELEGEERVER